MSLLLPNSNMNHEQLCIDWSIATLTASPVLKIKFVAAQNKLIIMF